MRIVQLTPGAGGMYCGNCLRDNALVAALRRQGHDVTMLPMYLPLKTDESDQSAEAPVFFGGINVYLEQVAPAFRRLPKWAHRALSSRPLLQWVGRFAARTRPEEVGDLTLSMLRGEEGNQAREIDELVEWMRNHGRPDVVSLSNALLVGCARRLKAELGATVAVTLQGEDAFLDALPSRNRQAAWDLVSARLAEADILLAPSRYYAERFAARARLPAERIHVIPNGINRAGWRRAETRPSPPALGFFARMCPEKGLDFLVEAYIQIRRNGRVPALRLHVGGGMGPSDESFVGGVKRRLQSEGLLGDVEFRPNLDHAAKQEFFRGLSVFSVPAHCGEAFGLYLVEAMAAGIPIVQPDTGAFPEIVEESGAGRISRIGDAADLARHVEEILTQPDLAARYSEAGLRAVETRYNSEAAARDIAVLFASGGQARSAPAAPVTYAQ